MRNSSQVSTTHPCSMLSRMYWLSVGIMRPRAGPLRSLEIQKIQMSGGTIQPTHQSGIVANWRIVRQRGYRNCRVYRFSPDGQLVRSWGGAGAAPGCFVIPHSIALDGQGRVVVCDRENDRIQIFSSDGEFLNALNNVQADGCGLRSSRIYVRDRTSAWSQGPKVVAA